MCVGGSVGLVRSIDSIQLTHVHVPPIAQDAGDAERRHKGRGVVQLAAAAALEVERPLRDQEELAAPVHMYVCGGGCGCACACGGVGPAFVTNPGAFPVNSHSNHVSHTHRIAEPTLMAMTRVRSRRGGPPEAGPASAQRDMAWCSMKCCGMFWVCAATTGG